MNAHVRHLPRCDGLEYSCPSFHLLPAGTQREERVKEMTEIGDYNCFVRKLCELAVEYIVDKCDSLIPGNAIYDVSDMMVIEIAKSMEIELKMDKKRDYRFRLGRCPCWNGHRAAYDKRIIAPETRTGDEL